MVWYGMDVCMSIYIFIFKKHVLFADVGIYKYSFLH
jgi:hypothetical protein